MAENKAASNPQYGGGRGSSLLAHIETVNEATNKSAKEKMRVHRKSSTLAQLNTTDLRLHGRESDMEMLMGKLKSIDDLEKELIMVVGSSGCGKSALVMRGLRDPAKKMGIAFCGGKFDLNNNALPYSAFAKSLAELAKHILASKNASEIEANIDVDDMQLISQVMNVYLFPTQSKHHPEDMGQTILLGEGKEAVLRMQYALRRLMKVICSHLPVVMFIDDLQWADDASLDLLLSLQMDDEIRSLLLVGAYRDNEVADGHPLAIRLREAETVGCVISTIALGNLDQNTVQSLVAEVVRMDEDSVDTLATTIHKKTGGNPFFVLTFLTSIYEEELLQYNLGAMRWIWDDEAVKQKYATENVTSMMVSKLKRFKLAAQNTVKVASCLGASFSTKVLKTIIKESMADTEGLPITDDETEDLRKSFTFSDGGTDESSLEDVVKKFEDAGMWERETDEVCRFAHDQIQAAALELIPQHSRSSFKGLIGQAMLKKFDKAMIDESLFVIVSLRNHAISSLTNDERSELVQLNIRAGLRASKNAAFDAAVVYFQAARDLVGSNAWDVDQEQMVTLYSAEAQARFILGDLDVMETLVEEILSKTNLSMKDKIQAYETKILAATTGNRFGEAVSTTAYVCGKLGFKPLPTKGSKSGLMKEYMEVNNLLKGLGTEDLLSLPDLTDERVIMGQRMMELRLAPQYHSNPDLHPFVVLSMVRESITSGLNRSACDAFSTFGFILCGAFGELERGRQMGEVAERLLAKPGMRPMKSRTIYIVQNMIYHWTAPLHKTCSPLLQGYQAGLESGDIESAAYNLTFRGWMLWFGSRPLGDLSHELKIKKDVLVKLKNENLRLCLLPHLQASINLQSDNAANPWELSGEEMVFEELLDLSVKTHNGLVRATLILTQLELFVMFQDWVSAKKLMVTSGDLRPGVFGFFQSVRYTFIEGLICLKAMQTSGLLEKRKMKARAKKSLNMLHDWLKKGNPNVVHMVHLLEAEFLAMNKKEEKATEKYKAAVVAATKAGLLQDKALAHELAGLYYMGRGDAYWADYNLKLAHTTYLDWKATAKAADLAVKYPQSITDKL